VTTAVSVSPTELKRFLGVSSSTDDTLLQEILDSVEGLFLEETNRIGRPFLAAATENRAEVRDGTGSHVLTLDYPIGDVDSIKLGYDSANPDETLDPDDVDEVVWVAGKRTIERVDGGTWGAYGAPRYVHVQYDTGTDVPDAVKLAIKRMAAVVYRQLGSEGSTRESVQGFSRELAETDPFWVRCINNHREPRS
jgi:hypothetical protein